MPEIKKKNRPFREFIQKLRQQMRTLNLQSTLLRDLHAIYEFYLTPKERKDLAAMGWFRRWLYRGVWFAKSILSKLSITRELLLLLSFFLFVGAKSQSHNVIAYALLIVILLLELKDKLLARDELRAGRAIQEALRPQQCPELAGWDAFLYSQSANEVGGDLLDCLDMNNQHVGFMVGDVSGKGLGAALLMAQLQASVEALVSHIPSLPNLTAQLNKLYCRDDLANCFISFIFLKAAEHSSKVSYVNAGHLPPVVISQNRVTESGKGGLALGLSATTKYKQESLTLQPNDVLVVYTDGVTEARNEDGEFYGDERFFRMLESLPAGTAQSLGKAIIRDVEIFCGDAGRSDDLTLMILKKIKD